MELLSDEKNYIVAFDLDGTTVSDSKKFDELFAEYIKLNIDKYFFIAVTGRMNCSARNILNRYNLEIPVISYNGSMVTDSKNNVVFSKYIKKSDSLNIIDFLKKNNIHFNLFSDDDLCYYSENKFSLAYEEHSGIKGRIISENDIAHDSLLKILAITEDFNIKKITEFIKKQYSDRFFIANSFKNFIEICRPDINKGKILKEYIAKNFDDPYKLIAFGDAENDMEMLKIADVKVAIKNSNDKLEDIADYLIPGPKENGVFKFLSNGFERYKKCRFPMK